MTRIASLPWYDLPASHIALDRFWDALRVQLHAQGVDGLPTSLTRTMPTEQQWRYPELLLSQCCGLDLFVSRLPRVAILARPVFADLDCDPGNYFSHIVRAKGATWSSRRPRRIVVNSRSSRSGHTALLAWLLKREWSARPVLVSGSHARSLDWLRAGRADLAAIDAHSWKYLDISGVEIVGRSTEAPAPPFICSPHMPADAVLRGLRQAVAKHGAGIGMTGIIPSSLASYSAIEREYVRTREVIEAADRTGTR